MDDDDAESAVGHAKGDEKAYVADEPARHHEPHVLSWPWWSGGYLVIPDPRDQFPIGLGNKKGRLSENKPEIRTLLIR